MSAISRYYVSRALFCMVFGGLFALAGWPWWLAVLAGVLPFAIFLWLPYCYLDRQGSWGASAGVLRH
jgi:hypothetical protein